MSLSDGESAKDGDVWFRIITNDRHIKNGKINHAAFKGKFLGVPDPELKRPWTQEASGRLRSIAGTRGEVVKHAEQFCSKVRGKYSGVMFCPTSEARGSFFDISTAVNYTPIKTGEYADEAHADLNFTGKLIEQGTPEEDQMCLYLSDIVVGLHPDQIRVLPEPSFTPTLETSSRPAQETGPGPETTWLNRLFECLKSAFGKNA
jgi:hypothetical protein